MDHNDTQDPFPKIEINIANTNPNSQIVLNDLRLLELLYKFPFLISSAVVPQDDKDYEEWGWQEIAKFFNKGYEGYPLSAPFSVEELQWRWKILRPLCPSLAKASHQIPETLCKIIEAINMTMEVPPPIKPKTISSGQKFILDQISFVEQLSQKQQRCLEVDILDALFNNERNSRSIEELTPEDIHNVNKEYEKFLQLIRVRELPKDSSKEKKNSLSNASPPIIVNNKESNLVISSVRGMQPTEKENDAMEVSVGEPSAENYGLLEGEQLERFEVEPMVRIEPFAVEPQKHFEMESQDMKPAELLEELVPKKHNSEEHLKVELEPLEVHQLDETEQPKRRRGRPKRQVSLNKSPTKPTNDLQLRYVPLKSAKYYVKKVRVRLKRIDLDEYLPLANLKKISNSSRSSSMTLSI